MSSQSYYLASASPRRKALLEQIGLSFSVLSVNVEEQQDSSESAQDYVQRLSRDKAKAGVGVASHALPVIGSDTIVVCDGDVLEKPADLAHSRQMLRRLSGKKHQVMTAVSVADRNHTLTTLVITDVWFKSLSDQDIDDYWQTGEPADKAGSYAIQGIGGRFVTRMEGSYHAVVGLPLYETEELLNQFKVLTGES
ncbi:septum formation inhibitor Maf [Veronia nyctiphanis]|uniref:dTTP/UTP pyrophosphatase n=1 Tax=Veronia nyctiphanis TaxID=1278244 RepID=A0A4Q0YMG5_9GAMM|nr:Maf family protein [Veronia nyctiphanis]RXJ71936.1 septum formation inhibitor Maf [Veronia nyctiphanis]